MKTYHTLVLTDHSGHSDQNSIYSILRSMVTHEQCAHVDVASRGLSANADFFDLMDKDGLMGTTVTGDFRYSTDGTSYTTGLRQLVVSDYDLVFMRLPRPISDDFLSWLSTVFAHAIIVNDPQGIQTTSNKQFLLQFPDLCPDTRLCHSVDDVLAEAAKYKIVLKPLREYGGRGLLKIDGDHLDDGTTAHNTVDYLATIDQQLKQDGYLSMRFLKNVSQGDKRILVADGTVMAASLRLPADGSWLCNVAQGGTSVAATVDDGEYQLIDGISDHLRKEGIFMYGVDTLVNDDGHRVISEINTLSIGGWPQAEAQTGRPIISTMINKLYQYADRQQ